MPQLGMEFASKEIQIPTFTIPSEHDLSLPLMGMMEMSAKVDSNYYNWEGTMSVDSPSNMAKFSVVAKSPVELLAFSSEGNFIFIIFATKKTFSCVISYKTKQHNMCANILLFSFLKDLQKSPTQQTTL